MKNFATFLPTCLLVALLLCPISFSWCSLHPRHSSSLRSHEADIRSLIHLHSTRRYYVEPGSVLPSHYRMAVPQVSVFPKPPRSPSLRRPRGPLEVDLPVQCLPRPCQIPELQKPKMLQPLLLLLAGTQAASVLRDWKAGAHTGARLARWSAAACGAPPRRVFPLDSGLLHHPSPK